MPATRQLPPRPRAGAAPLHLLIVSLMLGGAATAAREPAEALDRGVVAVRLDDGSVFLSWRSLAGDPPGCAFDIFRAGGGDTLPVRVNGEPLADATCFVDQLGGMAYTVVPAAGSADAAVPSAPAPVLDGPYLEVPLRPIEGYRPGDCAAGDLDGDGRYELVVQQDSRPRDNSHRGLTGSPVLDAYTLDGEFLWRIDLGRNIREGEHYTQFLVYDLDGDGRAEVVCKTADGTTDGTGSVIGDPDADWRVLDESSQSFGRVLSGPELLTVFDGRTGEALATVDYVPGREPIDGWGGVGGNGNNDSYGNRSDRFLACVAYLDGERPSAVMCRGVYGRTALAAWDWRGGKLARRWVFDSGTSYPPFDDASPYSGMGGHSLAVSDVDADGKDEVVYHAMTIDDDGTGLYSTGRRHGDRLHLGDFDPDRPGLELYLVSENEGHTVRWGTPGAGLHDAQTGTPLWTHSPGVDITHGAVADIDPRHPGAEVWGGPGPLRTIGGVPAGPAPPVTDWLVWWDADLLRELYGGGRISKWDWESGRAMPLWSADGRRDRRSFRRRPNLGADLVGDWREELVLPGPHGDTLRVYTTTTLTEHRLTTLMQDPHYRLSVASQNVAYNAVPHPGTYLGTKGEPGGE